MKFSVCISYINY